ALDAVAHRLDANDVPHDFDIEGLAVAAANGHRDGAVDRAAHPLYRLTQGQAQHAFVIDVGDEVARLHSGVEGRGVVDGGHHFHQAFLHGDLDAQPPEFAPGLGAHFAEAVGIKIAGVRIEIGEHAANGRLDQFLVADFLDVVGAHALEHL